jgi:hypothetical protein
VESNTVASGIVVVVQLINLVVYLHVNIKA